MKFRYKKYGPYIRPVISIKVKFKNKAVSYEVLVDSGADECMFDAEIAEILGIDVESGEMHKAMGVGGQTVVYFVHPVEIEVGGWSHEIKAGFIQRVSGPAPYGALGQKGFFDKFVVKFDLMKEEIELKSH